MPDQSSFNLSTAKTGPVECLGQSYPSEEARREHFLKLLAAKLKEPAFRQIEGFPLGTDEAILALSDPPYYTACPNPWLGEFIKHYGTDYDPKKPYHREPFAADVSEGKNHPIYNAHGYHTKAPHRAIMRYVLHFTNPGDLIFDGFCGTGMTGVAAQLCGDKNEIRELGYRLDDQGNVFNSEGISFTKAGNRIALLNDLSPAATFIASNYNSHLDFDRFSNDAEELLDQVSEELGWMHGTTHPASGEAGTINFTVWSQVFVCSNCSGDIVFWEAAVDHQQEQATESFRCPNCSTINTKRTCVRREESKYDPIVKKVLTQAKFVPVLINYSIHGKRHEKKPDATDLIIIQKADDYIIKDWIPTHLLPDGDKMGDPFNLGIRYVHQFYTKRNLIILASIYQKLEKFPPSYKFWFTSALMWVGRENRLHLGNYFGKKGGVITSLRGTWYVASLSVETSVIERFKLRIRAQEFRSNIKTGYCATSTLSTSAFNIAENSVDYIFLDPPFGSNLMYSELNVVWEAWLRVITQNTLEAIENRTQKKGAIEYKHILGACLKNAYRILKPGRWITVEFSNTSAGVWNTMQAVMQEAGFVVANVSALNKEKGSFNAVNNATSVKQDLVISAYKPNGGLEVRFAKHGQTTDGVWDFIRTHLRNLPVTIAKGGQLQHVIERDPRILYDRMVAFYVGHSTPVPLSSGEFQAELQEQFPTRDGMAFLPEQVNVYDSKRVQMESIGQMAIFVEDERSAIDWVRQQVKEKPQTTADLTPEFHKQLNESWKKWEARPELRLLLDQNFLCYDGVGEVPSQIHSYLSTQFKELRNLDKDHAQLRHKAKDRWYVPDPKKNIDVETLRNKRLLEEFWLYLPEGYISAARNPDKAPTLPGMAAATPRPKVPRSKKLREVRTEAIRVGFKHCYQLKDYYTILAVADMLPESVLNEDEQLQMLYDNAAMRSGTSTS